ncbi:MAG: hypothetical protein ABR599_02855 [Gemmatimonadota bacterium]
MADREDVWPALVLTPTARRFSFGVMNELQRTAEPAFVSGQFNPNGTLGGSAG